MACELPFRVNLERMKLRIVLIFAFAAVLLTLLTQPLLAQEPTKKPFILPFKDPPGPDTWLLGQTYGNTTGAYGNRREFYLAGQGLHFGIDLSAPCRTQVLAIGDGVVLGADGPWGSAPHNLLIDHRNGYWSLYGHLFEKPKLK